MHCTLYSVPKYTIEELVDRSKCVVDPFTLVQKDITSLSGGIKELLGSDHPVLESCARYGEDLFLLACCVCLTVVLAVLVAAVAVGQFAIALFLSLIVNPFIEAALQWIQHSLTKTCVTNRYFFDIDGGKKIRPTMVLLIAYALSHSHAANNNNNNNTSSSSIHNVGLHTSAQTVNNNSSDENQSTDLVDLSHLYATPSQTRLAEITEIIHTASLFHDDVIDKVGVVVVMFLF